MADAQEFVNNALNGDDDPSSYVDWLGKKEDVGPLARIRFGVHIHTTDEEVITQNAKEDGTVTDEAFWKQINDDAHWLEENMAILLREMGLYVQGEGHGDSGEYVGSAWIQASLPQEQQVYVAKKIVDLADGDMPSTTNGTLWKCFYDSTTKLYRNVKQEIGAKYLDVTVEFTGTDALTEWLKLNLVESEAVDADDPAMVVQSYREKYYQLLYGAGFDCGAYAGTFSSVDQALSAARERKLLRKAKHVWIIEEHVPDAPTGVFVGSEPTGAIWDVVKGYQAVRRVTEAKDVDDPETFVNNFDPYRYTVCWIDANDGQHRYARPFPTFKRAQTYAYQCSLWNKAKEITIDEVTNTSVTKTFVLNRDYKVAQTRTYDGRPGGWSTVTEAVEDDADNPEGYLDRVTGWIDTFIHAGLVPDPSPAHSNQFWKRYECDGTNFTIFVHVRPPLWILVMRTHATTGEGQLNLPFTFNEKDTAGMVTQFRALDRLLTQCRTRARGDWPAVDQELYDMEKQNERDRKLKLSGRRKLGEADADDPPEDVNTLLDKVSPEPCFRCGADLTKPFTVVRHYVSKGSDADLRLEGHYDAQEGIFTNDETYSSDFLDAISQYDLPEDCDTCKQCGKSTAKPNSLRNESVEDEPEVDPQTYADQIHNLAQITHDIQEYGLFVNRIHVWGRWVVLGGGAYWATETAASEKRLKADYFNQQIDSFMAKLGITRYHIKSGETTIGDNVWFQLALPKDQLEQESWQPFIRNTAWPEPDHETWLPESQARTITYEETDADALEKAGVVMDFGDNAWGDCASHGDPYLIKLDGQPVGWFQLTNQNELNVIEVLPDYQKQGIGTEIVRQLYGDAPDPAALTATPASRAGAALLRRFGINDPEVYEALDPDDPAVNIERHTTDLDLPALMDRLGFKAVHFKHSGTTYWEKVVGPRCFTVSRDKGQNALLKVHAAFGYPQSWVDASIASVPINELEMTLNQTPCFLTDPANPVVESVDPDDPSVNVDRHVGAMDAGKILPELGFSERLPSWNCADKEYKWWEKFDNRTGFKWTVVRKSEDEPQIMEVSISRMKIRPGHTLHDWEQIGGFNTHIGDLARKLKQAARMKWGVKGDDRFWGRNIQALNATQEALDVPDPDDPEPNIEAYKQHVEKTEADALESAIANALLMFGHRVSNVDSAQRADELAVEIATYWAEAAGYQNGSDEYDHIVSALSNRAGELFPGDWEDYPNTLRPPVAESLASAQMDWSEFFAPLIDANVLSQAAADKYANSQNLESNENLYYLFLEADEASQYANDDDYNACIDKILRIIRVTNMRYGSAIKAIATDPNLDTSLDEAQVVSEADADEGDPERYLKSLPIPVKATCIEDHMVEGERLQARFDAAEWFEKATLEQLITLAKQEFQSSYAADEVGEYFFDTQLKDWHESYRGDGFEVYIDEDSVKLWVEHNRPDWYAYLWPAEIQVKEDIDDPSPELMQDAFDVPTILKRRGYERHGDDYAWSKVYHGFGKHLDYMIEVRQRGYGGGDAGDAVYDATLFHYIVADNPKKEWTPFAHRYARNNKNLEPMLKALEARVAANKLRGIVTDPDIPNNPEFDDFVVESVDDPDDAAMAVNTYTQDLVPDPDKAATINKHPHGEAEAELQVLGFAPSWIAGKNTIFGEPEIPNFWSKSYRSAHGGSSKLLYVKIIPEGKDAAISVRTRSMSIPVALKPRSMAHIVTIIKDVDAAVQRAADNGLTKEQEIDAIVGVLDHHRQWCRPS